MQLKPQGYGKMGLGQSTQNLCQILSVTHTHAHTHTQMEA